MEPKHPLSAKRLYALIGDKMHDFPPYFVERLERSLEEMERQRMSSVRVVPFRSTRGLSATPNSAAVAIPVSTLQSLDYVLEILLTHHLARSNGSAPSAVTDHMVEGLIVAGRELLKTSGDNAWSEA
jgi:hypothetical protein